MATAVAGDAKVRARAALILQMLTGVDLATAAKQVGIGLGTAKDKVLKFNVGGWKSLLTVMAPRGGDFIARYDRITKKPTYKIPLSEGLMLGEMPEPEMEGKVFKAPSGKVTVYGRLTGSSIVVSDQKVLERLADGTLKTGMDSKTAAAIRRVKEIEEDDENNLLGLEV